MYPPVSPMSNPWAYSNTPPPQQGRGPWMMPGTYSPGQVAFNSNPEMSQLISMMSPAVMSSMAGPNSFIPHMMPIMSQFDQLNTRNFQQQRFQAMGDVSQDNNAAVADRFLGMSRIFSDTKANDPLFQEQMSFAASIANNPAAKMIMGQVIGADNVEAMLHGSKGDVSALNAKMSQMAYFMADPSGVGRMGADAMASYSRGVYSHIYEPDIDVEQEETAARSTDPAKRSRAKQRLRDAAQTESDIVDDTEIVDRLVKDAETSKKTAELYTKYVAGGTETDAKKQAEALVKYDRAIKESGVLTLDEMSISQAGKAAADNAVANARGFGAGQVGQMAEYLLQTGQIGSSIGTKSLEERVAAVAEQDVSDATFSRMGRELAKKRFSDTDNQSDEARRYRSLTTQAEREAFIRDNSGQFEQEIRATKQAAEQAAAGGKGAPSLEDVEKLGGFQNLAVDVDADKTSKSLKGYLDAAAAVRDIFGDNGNPNAPMPALIATLNALTGTAGAQLSSQKIASSMRELQIAAKEAGVGQEELLNTRLNAQAQASALGLTDADALRATQGAMLARKVMTESGAFNTPSYGEYNAQQAQQLSTKYDLGFAASSTNASLTAMVAMYESSPELFKGTAVEAAVEAYQAGEPTYIDPDTGATVDFANVMATQGPTAVRGMLRDAATKGKTGEDAERAAARIEESYITEFNNRQNIGKTNEEFGTYVQAEGLSDIASRASVPTLSARLEEADAFDKLNITDDTQKYRVAAAISRRLEDRATEAIELPEAEQSAFMQKNVEEDIRQGLIDAGRDPQEAAREAKRLAADDRAFGGEFGKLDLGTYVARADVANQYETGELLANNKNARSKEFAERRANAKSDVKARAVLTDKMNRGRETTPLQRASDYFAELQTGNEKFTGIEAIKESLATGRTMPEVLREIDPVMARALEASDERINAAIIDANEINSAEAAAKRGDATALRELAQVADDTTIITDQEASDRLLARLNDKTQTSDEQLIKDASRYAGRQVTKEELQDPGKRTDIIRSIAAKDDYYAANFESVLTDKETTVLKMRGEAAERMGQAAAGLTQDEAEAIVKREEQIQAGLLGGQSDQDDRERTIEDAVFAVEKLAMADKPKTRDGSAPKFTDEQHNKFMELVSGPEPGKTEDFEKLADDLKLTDDKKAEFVEQGEAIARAKQMGGFAAARVDKQNAGMETKLNDPTVDRTLPPVADKEAEKKATAAATEAEKLAAAGVIDPDAAKKAGADAEQKDGAGGQTEQVSVLKDILAAIRALGGEPTAAEQSGTGSSATPAATDGVKHTPTTEKALTEIKSAEQQALEALAQPTAEQRSASKKSVVGAEEETGIPGGAARATTSIVQRAKMLDAQNIGSIPDAFWDALQTEGLTEEAMRSLGPTNVTSFLGDTGEKPSIGITTLSDLMQPPTENVRAATADDPIGITSLRADGRNTHVQRAFNDYPAAGFPELMRDVIAGKRLGGGLFSASVNPRDSVSTDVSQSAPADNFAAAGILPSFGAQLPDPQTTAGMLVKESPVINPKPDPAPMQNQKLELNGRLTIDGLQEAILAATGETAVQTGGAPVMTG